MTPNEQQNLEEITLAYRSNHDVQLLATALTASQASEADLRAELAEANRVLQRQAIELAERTAERDELIRHKDTNECTQYGHRWRDAFGADGALCQCGSMVFAVWADEVRPSTDSERAHPAEVRVIDNPDRSTRARELDDEYDSIFGDAPAASTTSGGVEDGS